MNFAILNFFGYQFAPRYKDIYDVVSESLYGFKSPGSYDGIVKPAKKIKLKRPYGNMITLLKAFIYLTILTHLNLGKIFKKL